MEVLLLLWAGVGDVAKMLNMKLFNVSQSDDIK